MDYVDELKGKLPKFKIIDIRLVHYGLIVEAQQWSGRKSLYNAEINGEICIFHISQLELQ